MGQTGVPAGVHASGRPEPSWEVVAAVPTVVPALPASGGYLTVASGMRGHIATQDS